MKSLLIIAEQNYNRKIIKRVMEKHGDFLESKDNELDDFYVSANGNYVEIYEVTREMLYFEEDALKHCKINNPIFYCIGYDNKEWMILMLEEILNEDQSVWIDNDIEIISGSKVLRMIINDDYNDFIKL